MIEDTEPGKGGGCADTYHHHMQMSYPGHPAAVWDKWPLVSVHTQLRDIWGVPVRSYSMASRTDTSPTTKGAPNSSMATTNSSMSVSSAVSSTDTIIHGQICQSMGQNCRGTVTSMVGAVMHCFVDPNEPDSVTVAHVVDLDTIGLGLSFGLQFGLLYLV